MKYAENTEVPVERSRAEIESTVQRYGAGSFISGWQGNRAMVAFEMRERRIKFLLPLPDPTSRDYTHVVRKVNATKTAEVERTPEQCRAAWEQACRQRWRALALAIKAKLEAVESGISQFEEEFMANIVMDNGMTIGEGLLPQLGEVIECGKLPPMLPGPGQSTVGRASRASK